MSRNIMNINFTLSSLRNKNDEEDNHEKFMARVFKPIKDEHKVEDMTENEKEFSLDTVKIKEYIEEEKISISVIKKEKKFISQFNPIFLHFMREYESMSPLSNDSYDTQYNWTE